MQHLECAALLSRWTIKFTAEVERALQQEEKKCYASAQIIVKKIHDPNPQNAHDSINTLEYSIGDRLTSKSEIWTRCFGQ